MSMMKIGDSERRLLDAALKAMRNAHVLWGLKVGAAVLADDGHVYEGCNVES
jgi:cytidine deaminase